MSYILSFGEILIRQQRVGDHFFEPEKNYLEIFPGGSEANVAVSLALMGHEVSYVSAFPENALSHDILGKLEELQIDTSKVIFSGDRIGSYILMSANGLSKGEVIYDRKYSSFSQLEVENIDIDQLLDDVNWLHWTALTPALNQQMAIVIHHLLKEAKARGIKISVDLNYRNKLWQYGKQPIDVMPILVEYCDVIMGNIWAANKMLGTFVDDTLDRDTPQETFLMMAEASAKEVFQKFPNCRHIAYTFRFMDSPTHNLFYGTYHTPETNVHSQTFETFEVIDRIGSGDAFMAGFIHGLVQDKNPQEVIDIATGAGYHKLFVKGDFGDGKYE